MNSQKAELLMVTATLAWGSSYLLMKVGLDGISPFNLIALRFGIAFICMAAVFLPRFRYLTVIILGKGILMGTLLFLLFTGLVFGVKNTTASSAGFLASTTVIIVPILDCVLKRRLPNTPVVFSILLAIFGLFLLTVKDSFAFDKGAGYCLLAALFYAIYIIVFDKFAKQEDRLLVSIIQLGVASIFGIILMLCFEIPEFPKTSAQWGAILGLGIACSAFGFVVLPFAQRYVSPEKIGLIFSLEPVFSALLSYVFLHEVLGVKGYIGAGLVFTSIVLSRVVKPKSLPT